LIRVDGMRDSLAFAKDGLMKTGVGLAFGAAFGDGDHPVDDYLRLCFAATLPMLERAFDRLGAYLASG
jgi:aspartate aminotransferase